jgi:hypothetical protein
LIVLLTTRLTNEHDLDPAPAPAPVPMMVFALQRKPTTPPRTARDDPGDPLRLATIRSTRLQV